MVRKELNWRFLGLLLKKIHDLLHWISLALEEYFLLLRPLFLAFGSQNFVSVERVIWNNVLKLVQTEPLQLQDLQQVLNPKSQLD